MLNPLKNDRFCAKSSGKSPVPNEEGENHNRRDIMKYFEGYNSRMTCPRAWLSRLDDGRQTMQRQVPSGYKSGRFSKDLFSVCVSKWPGENPEKGPVDVRLSGLHALQPFRKRFYRKIFIPKLVSIQR